MLEEAEGGRGEASPPDRALHTGTCELPLRPPCLSSLPLCTHHVKGAEAATPTEQQCGAPKGVADLAEEGKLVHVPQLRHVCVADL